MKLFIIICIHYGLKKTELVNHNSNEKNINRKLFLELDGKDGTK